METIDPLKLLADLVDVEGVRGTGRKISCSPQYICEVLKRKKDPGPSILDALGLEKVITYRRKVRR